MINDRVVHNFIKLLSQKLESQDQLPSLYNDSFIYEDADAPFSIEEPPLNQNKEYIAYSTEKIYKHPTFQSFMAKNNLATLGYSVFIREAILLDNISVQHLGLHLPFHKTIVKLNGSLFNMPERDYQLNFVNSKEWVLHVYDKKKLLYYFFSTIDNNCLT